MRSLQSPAIPAIANEENPILAQECLASWYSTHSQVRRLWAIAQSDWILIVIKIEPTLDGYDAMPAWLAHRVQWAEELRFALRHQVRLEMLGAPSSIEALSAMNDQAITEISWREEYF